MYLKWKATVDTKDPYMKRIIDVIESDLTYIQKSSVVWYLYEERKKEKKDNPQVDESRCPSIVRSQD
jgi:hypothetical protein